MTTFIFSPVKNKETMNAAKQLRKHKEYFNEIIYTSTPNQLEKFIANVKSGDTVEFHADGLPWVTGGVNYNPEYDYDAYRLAELFSQLLKDKDITLTIDLRFCTSGVNVTGPKGNLCFSQDLSQALNDEGFNNITVYGYNGYVNSQSMFKQSLSEIGTATVHGAKVKHCKLEEGRGIYKNGLLVEAPKKNLITSYSYDEAEYTKDATLRGYLQKKNSLNAKRLKKALKASNDALVQSEPLLEKRVAPVLTLLPLQTENTKAKIEAPTKENQIPIVSDQKSILNLSC